MATVSLQVSGAAPSDLAWERYDDPRLWSTWAPQIQRVETTMSRLEAGATGTVHAGLLPWPTLPVSFEVLEVARELRRWSWRAWVGPVSLTLEHTVDDRPEGSTTGLRVHGPGPLLLAYAPVARLALRRLVGPPE